MPRWTRVAVWLGVGSLLLCGPFRLASWALRGLDYRCNAHPPGTTFTRYVGPPSPGIWDIRATGYSSLGGAAVWMRFRYSGNALSAVLPRYKKLAPTNAMTAVASLTEPGMITDPVTEPPAPDEEHQVHWKELKQVRNPEVYIKPLESGGDTTLVVDRSRRLVYFFHWSQ